MPSLVNIANTPSVMNCFKRCTTMTMIGHPCAITYLSPKHAQQANKDLSGHILISKIYLISLIYTLIINITVFRTLMFLLSNHKTDNVL